MASYPNTIYEPRAKENKSGVEYDPTKKTVIFAEDFSKLDDEVVAMQTVFRFPISIPAAPVAGSAYFDTATFTLYIYTGAVWKSVVLG
jgi:hypothetical protein